MKFPCTGVILAGGMNTRFSGQDKAFLSVGGKRIIDHLYSIFNALFEDIILVTNDPYKYLEWDIKIVTDIFPVRSSLTGIHAGLFYALNPFAYFAACDTPFLKRELVEIIINSIEQRVDVVIPETAAGLEPLCAVYSKKCLKPVEQQIIQNKFKIQQLLQKRRVKKIAENILREKDPDLMSFFNINTPQDQEKAEKMLEITKTEETYYELDPID
ncbi:MAG: molybdenum cofactor guanylyltransferase [Deltaproteobacteria bacterium]|nr:molybdenum cofactor guanylyltransferase [Deltaproteobacteria bacterium]MBW2590097.1 molybdenum cofactor guanylyltransferase [Deltaproteobacteria bacterium]